MLTNENLDSYPLVCDLSAQRWPQHLSDTCNPSLANHIIIPTAETSMSNVWHNEATSRFRVCTASGDHVEIGLCI